MFSGPHTAEEAESRGRIDVGLL